MECITKNIINFELKLMVSKGQQIPKTLPVNYLCDEGKIPSRREDQFYEFDKVKKSEYGYVYGTESHTRRRKMIL
jgi:hypothetical protein